ncbi:MAG: hypothetical protein V2A58_14940, partial [Planctomycetota bacterium]
WSYKCGNPDHGYGETHRAIRGDRELNKRVYTMMKQFGRPLWKFDHASNFVCSVTSPFSDLFTTGEEMRGNWPKDKQLHAERPYLVKSNYFHTMRLDYFRACGATGRQWGVTPCLLTQMTDGSPGYTEALYAILIPHDAIPVWEALMRDIRYMRRVQRTMEEFGIGVEDVEFLPYWHEETPAKVEFTPDAGGAIRPFQVEYEVPEVNRLRPEEAVGASVYAREGKRSLVVVFNYTQDAGVARVRIEPEALGLRPERALATDAFTRFSWVRADRPIDLTVKSLDYRLIWVEEEGTIGAPAVEIAEAFPPYREESLLAGYRPDAPLKEQADVEIAGDLRKEPWADGGASYTGPQRTELAQTFTITRPVKVNRIEVYLRDSEGAFAIRKPVKLSIVKVDASGLPSEDVAVGEKGFAPIEADSRSWRYAHFETRGSAHLGPGRYALVFRKAPEAPEENFHTRFVSVPSAKVSGEYIASREMPGAGGEAFRWRKEADHVLCFGVYGYEEQEAQSSAR